MIKAGGPKGENKKTMLVTCEASMKVGARVDEISGALLT